MATYINVIDQKLSLASPCSELIDGSQEFVKIIFYLGEE